MCPGVGPTPTPTLTPTPTSTPTPTPTPTPAQVNVSGQAFDAANFTTNGLGQCSPIGGSGVRPGGGSTVNIYTWPAGASQGTGGGVNPDGTYSVNTVPSAGNKKIQLNNISGYTPLCPASGYYIDPSGVSVASPNNTGWNFILTSILPAWGQAIAGNVHAQNGATISIPSGKYFIDDLGPNQPHGVASRLSASAFTVAPGTWSPATIWNYADTIGSGWRYGYTAMYQRAGSPSTALPGNGTNAPAAGVYYVSGSLTISGTWNIPANTKIVIFVNGNVNINASITAPVTSFVAIISSDDITVSPIVGHTVKATPGVNDADLTGVFLADGDWNGCPSGCSTTKQLVVYGTVAGDADVSGTGNVNFNRDLGAGNNTGPGVAVIWNPNLLLNVDSSLKDAVTSWTGEVAP